jgi:hypothetical protein
MKYITIICGALLFISCASRKVDLNLKETKTDSLVEKTFTLKDTISQKKESKINYQIFTDISEFNITPIDTSKPIEINGIKYKNSILNFKKTKVNSLYVKEEKESKNTLKKIVGKSTLHLKKNENIKQKKIDKKASCFIYLWLLFIPLFYLIYDTFKNKT